jgi:hypothetical protein
MLRRISPIVLLLALAGVLLTGCAGAKTGETGQVPESASLAPQTPLAYATVTTDEGSDQRQKTASLLERIPGLRDGLAGSVASGLREQGIDWDVDVRPALGPELVVVATADKQPLVLVQPEDESKLEALLDKSDTTYVRGTVDDWQAVAQSQSALDAYRAALRSGTLEGVERFTDGFEALPADSLARVWVDTGRLSKELGQVVDTKSEIDLGLDWLAAALTAKDDGMLLTVATRDAGRERHAIPARALRSRPGGCRRGALLRRDARASSTAFRAASPSTSSRSRSSASPACRSAARRLPARRGRALRPQGRRREAARGDARPRAARPRQDVGDPERPGPHARPAGAGGR